MSEDRTPQNARKTEYLLDTGLMRSLSKSEEEELSKRKGIVSFTASYVVPIEILSGTLPKDHPKAEDQNKFRKAGLGRYYRLVGLDGTYWEEPHVLIAKAFGIQLQDTDDL